MAKHTSSLGPTQHITTRLDFRVPLLGPLTVPSDLAGQPWRLSSFAVKPFLSSAATAAYSTGAAVASIAAAAILFQLPSAPESAPLEKTPSASPAFPAPRSESRLKALEEEAVVAALAAAAATAAAAAERARIAAQAALAVQVDQECSTGVDEMASTIQSDTDEKPLNGARSQTPRQSDVVSTAKRRRVPKPRPPRPSGQAPRSSVLAPRLSAATPRVSGPRTFADEVGTGHLPLGGSIGPVHPRAPPAPPVSPRFASRLAELVSSVVPNNVPFGGGFTQTKPPLVKGWRGSVSRAAKGGNHRLSSPSGNSDASEPTLAPTSRLTSATHSKPSQGRHGPSQGGLPTLHSNSATPNSPSNASHSQPTAPHTQSSALHAQSATSHLHPVASHPQLSATHPPTLHTSTIASHPHVPPSQAQIPNLQPTHTSHTQPAGPYSLQQAHTEPPPSQSQQLTLHQRQTSVHSNQTTSHQQPTSQSDHPPPGKLRTSPSSYPSVTLATHGNIASVPSTQTLMITAGSMPVDLVTSRFAVPLTAGYNPSSQQIYASSFDHHNGRQSCKASLVNTTGNSPFYSRPVGTPESSRIHISTPPLAEHQYAQPSSQPLAPPAQNRHSYVSLPPRSIETATGSVQLFGAPTSPGLIPHVTVAMLPNMTSHQWLTRHPVETTVKAHRTALGQRPSSATLSSVGLRGRALNRTSISAAALDRSKVRDSANLWPGGKIAAPADDPSSPYPGKVPSSAEVVNKQRPSWSYHFQPVPLSQEPAVGWSGTWDDANATNAPSFTVPSVEEELKEDSKSWPQDSFNFGVDPHPMIPSSATAWDLVQSGSKSSLPQSLQSTDAPLPCQSNNLEDWRSLGSVSCERKSSVHWDKNAPATAAPLPRANLSWLSTPREQAPVQWVQSPPRMSSEKDESSADTASINVQSLDNTLKIAYQDALYQQRLLQTCDDAHFQQQLMAQQSLEQPLQPQHPQQSQQQHYPETVLEEASPDEPQ